MYKQINIFTGKVSEDLKVLQKKEHITDTPL